MAVYLLSRLLPDAVTLALWAALALGTALMFARFGWRDHGQPRLRKVSVGLASVFAAYALTIFPLPYSPPPIIVMAIIEPNTAYNIAVLGPNRASKKSLVVRARMRRRTGATSQ